MAQSVEQHNNYKTTTSHTGSGGVASSASSAKQGTQGLKFSFDDIKFNVRPRETTETNDKQQDLLRQQYCNFRAFERTVEKITSAQLSLKEKWELEDNLNMLKIKWEHIEKANWELDYILQDEDTSYKQKYDAAEKIFDDLRKQIQHSIWNNAHYEKSTPKIEIPDFYGKYNQWLTFRDLYVESVHINPVLSKAQKMQHLKTKLKGEAEKLVQHLGVSAENYSSCWEILTHRYDNKRLLFTSYMNTLLNQPLDQILILRSLGGNCKGAMNLECKSIHTEHNFKLETLIMNKLISKLPTVSFSITNWSYLENLKLADPHFNISGPIDLLLGADIYSELILNGIIRSDNNYPVAQQTKLGWILCGNVKTFNCFVTLNDIENMARFWETEEVTNTLTSTNDEQYCEENYNATKRDVWAQRFIML